MKKSIKILTFVLTVLFCFSLTYGICLAYEIPEIPEIVDTSEIFEDVYATKWYKEAVDYAYTFNLFQGTSVTKFEPNSPMNRAMFVTVLARLDGADTSNDVSTKFTDVPTNKWYTGNVKWASDNEIVNGVTEKTFEPMSSITREQMCTMLVRYANYKGIVLETKADAITFKDEAKIKNYAKNAVYVCQRAGLVNGMTATTFEPAGTATRAQVAKILMGFHKDYIYEASTPEYPEPELPEPEYPEPELPPFQEPIDPTNPMNAIVNETGRENKTFLPMFDIDSTEFIKSGTKLTDLAGKTLQFFTSDSAPSWSYRNAKGETIDEWHWFKELKNNLYLNIKYIVQQDSASVESALEYMRAGKQCDIIYGNQAVYSHAITISRDLTQFINADAFSPGVNKSAMELVKWDKGYRVIAPIGSVNVLWYNETLSKELNLPDPHTLWKNGNWNWNTFKQYLSMAPNTTKDGQTLTAFVQWVRTGYSIWPSTNGTHLFRLDNKATVPTLINNWENPATMEAWEFITDVIKSVNYGYTSTEHMGLYTGQTLMSASLYDITYRDTEYSKNIKINWVPFPKSTNKNGQEVCQFMGNAMMLPKKTVKEDNVNIALKFMELWATRYSESIFDNLSVFEYHNFSYDERVEFYNYTNSNLSFALPMNDLLGVPSIRSFKNCFKAMPSYNVRVEAPKISDDIAMYVVESLMFGQ